VINFKLKGGITPMNLNIRSVGRKDGEVIPLTFDYMFVAILNNPDNIIILENFLSCYLDIPIETIRGHLKINTRDLQIDSKKDKNKQVDLVLEIGDDLYEIEMNNSFDKDIKERNVVYGCAIHGRQLKYKENYQDIHKFLQINFDNYTKGEKINKLITKYKLIDVEDLKEVLSEKFQFDVIHVQSSIELCYTEREKKLAYWCKAFQARRAKELIEVLEGHNLMEEEASKKYIDEVDKYSTDEEFYQIYTKYSKEEMERNTANENLRLKQQEIEQYEQNVKQMQYEVEQYEQSVKQMQEEANKMYQEAEQMKKDAQNEITKLETKKNNLVNEAKIKEKIEIVKNAISIGLSIDDIVKLTNFSKEEIENILN
jgi:predicted transposase/invertase (TIGR01784 family)